MPFPSFDTRKLVGLSLCLVILVLGVVAKERWPKLHTKNMGLVCDNATVDLGIIGPRSTRVISHTFQIRNVSSESASLKKVAAACGCTTTNPSTKIIAPGQSFDLPVKVDWTGRAGFQSSDILVLTDANQRLSLRITANITSGLVISPAKIDFGQIEPGKVATRTLTLFNSSDQASLVLDSAHSTNLAIEVPQIAQGAIISQNRPLELTITATSADAGGSL